MTTISAMPYNGSVTGTNHSFYQYTTVGTVGTIAATALTSDIDPEIYTDATFTTLSTNWSCTLNAGNTADSCTATTSVPAGTVLYIKAKNWAGTSGTFTLSATGGGATPTTVTTISAMPYNGSVTGTSDSFYKYTTVGTVGTISATALTSDIDPEVYTDVTFTTLSTNWACTANSGTTADSCTATTPVPAGTVLYIKARNWAGTSGTFTLSVAGGSTSTTGSLNVTNSTGQTIWNLYVAPAGSTTWGTDQLGASTLANGSSFTVNGIPAGSYDVMVVLADGTAQYQYGVSIVAAQTTTVTFGTTTTATVKINNQSASGSTVTQFYLSTSTTNWGANRLGGATIPFGATFTLSGVPAGSYYAKAVMSNGATATSTAPANIPAGVIYTFTIN